MVFLAGISQTTITPPVGVELAGYSFGPSVGVLDELEAQALYLENRDESLVILTADLLTFGGDFVSSLRQRIEQETGISGNRVMMCASHTHSGPTTMPFRQWGAVDRLYLVHLESALVEAVENARKNARPAHLAIGLGKVETISENRRGIVGMRDTSVPVLRFEGDDGKIICVLCNFSCHPVSLHSYRNLFSPDYPGYTRRIVRSVLGEETCVMFTLGTAGDINPAGYVPRTLTPQDSWRMGAILGCEVVKSALEAQAIESPTLKVNQVNLDLPVVRLPSVAELGDMREHFAGQAERMTKEGAAWEEIAPWEIQRDWAVDALDAWHGGVLKDSVSCEVTAIRLGGVVLFFAPLELFTETGLAIKAASPAEITLVCSNSNGALGYLPVHDAYTSPDYTNPDGLAPRVYGVHAFAQEAEPHFCQQSTRLIQGLFT